MGYSLLISFIFLLLQVDAFIPPSYQPNGPRQDPASRPGLKCKCYDGDSCWPSAAAWDSLNASVDGNLVKVVPLAAVCHNTFEGTPTYNAAARASVTANFND